MSIRQLTVIHTHIFTAIAVGALLAGCASQAWNQPAIPPFENYPAVEVEDEDILGVSEEMLHFVQQQIPRESINASRAFSLAYSTMDPNLLNFRYDPSKTLSGEEAFRQKTGNCLSFSNMFVAMARTAGMKAWYQEVEVPQEWSSINDTLLVSRHVNAVVKDAYLEYVVDVSRKFRNEEVLSRKISDKEALAQFYNNLGADALVEKQLAKAYAYFVKAIETDPFASYIWSNLGVVYRRNGQTEAARASYQTALELDPEELVALNNLYGIYLEEGNEAAARDLQKRVERHRRKNPYYLQQLADTAMQEQRYDDAIKLLHRAIRLKEEDYRFHVSLAQSLALNGEDEEAQLSLDRARQLAPVGIEPDSIRLTEPGSP